MINFIKLKLTVLILMLMFTLLSSSSVFAVNPFIEKKETKINQSNEDIDTKNNLKKLKEQLNSPLPLPQPQPPTQQQSEQSSDNSFNEDKWKIYGMIDNYVIIVDDKNSIRFIENESTISDKCVLLYPEILCGKKKENQTKSLQGELEKLKKENNELHKINNNLKSLVEEAKKIKKFLE